jgi:hypothetical protein
MAIRMFTTLPDKIFEQGYVNNRLNVQVSQETFDGLVKLSSILCEQANNIIQQINEKNYDDGTFTPAINGIITEFSENGNGGKADGAAAADAILPKRRKTKGNADSDSVRESESKDS